MIDYRTDLSKRENLIHFIKVTQQLIETDGIQGVSTRKIAAISGFHNSTIYFYFKDLHELIMLASIKRFQKYTDTLESLSRNTDSYENFYAIWTCFAESAFQYPCIFYNFFFGKYGDDLPLFLNVYYDLFPDKRRHYSTDIESMFYGKNYRERCRKILLPLIGDARTRVTQHNIDTVTDITVCFTKSLLSQKCETPSLDSRPLQNSMLAMLHLVIDREDPASP